MAKAIANVKSVRNITFELCAWGWGNVENFGPRFGHLWRTGPDVSDSWESIWTLTMKCDSENLEFRDLKLEDGISQMVFLLEKVVSMKLL